MSRKRPRDGEGWLQRAVEWVQGQGGSVHPSVKLSDDRQLYVDKAQEEGTELMRISFACLVSKATIESTSFGQQIIEAIQKVDSTELYSSVYDLAIALYLANFPAEKEAGSAADDPKFQPYLETLPERSSYDGLPRLWSEDDLKWLRGSPLLQRVLNQKKGIQKDYDLVRDKWEETCKSEQPFPSFEAFSYRLASVSSRAFAGFGTPLEKDKDSVDDDMNIAMVPILDLCNHCRGKSETKNLSYKRHQEPTTTGSTKTTIVVTASRKIEAGENLRITYGARANAQLLLNYGFCLPDNIEPDGSSNDFLEFSVDKPGSTETSSKTVELRAGPKAHSFHGFVNALDGFAPLPADGRPKVDDDEGVDDFDANEKEFDQWDMDMTADMMGEDDDGDEDEDDDDEEMTRQIEKSIEVYRNSLESFKIRLKEVQATYHLKEKELIEALAEDSSTTAKKRNAALLVLSEHRTIFFMLSVVRRLQQLLEGSGSKAALPDDGSNESWLTEADKKLLAEQAKEVASAFLAIRLPGWKAP